ncbi:MAG: DUF2203 domain-containing protein [Candidatus Promineifilaceae bacterium]
MTTRYFTVEEANSLLPEIEPLMARLLERRAKVVRQRREISDILENGTSDVGGAVPSALVQDFIVIERLVRRIRSYGCIIKDVNTGLIDFLSERDGREVFLCWRYGEPRVEFFHELHSGFLGREHV